MLTANKDIYELPLDPVLSNESKLERPIRLDMLKVSQAEETSTAIISDRTHSNYST